MADDQYIDLGLTAGADPGTIRDRILDRLAEALPDGWTAPEGGLVYLTADAEAEVIADREAQTIEVAQAIWQEFGASVHGVVIGQEQAASGTVTITATGVPVDGGLIPAATQLARGDVLLETVNDVTVATPTATVTGVAVVAVEPGVGGNIASGSVDLLAALGFAATASIDYPGLTGGVDGEDIDDYMDRLRLHVAHAGRPVLPDDFAARLRDLYPQVSRVLAIDLYDASVPTPNVEKHVTLVPVDELGETLSGPTLLAAAAALDAEREANFVVHVISPTYTTVNASATITVWPGWDSTSVAANAKAAVEDWLSPAKWGQPPLGESPEWHDEPIVLRDELSAVLNSVQGVRHVTLPKVAAFPSSPAASDLTLSGVGALTRPGTVTITVA